MFKKTLFMGLQSEQSRDCCLGYLFDSTSHVLTIKGCLVGEKKLSFGTVAHFVVILQLISNHE